MLPIVTPSTTEIIDLRTTEIKYMVKRPLTKALTLINLWPEPSRGFAFVSFHGLITAIQNTVPMRDTTYKNLMMYRNILK